MERNILEKCICEECRYKIVRRGAFNRLGISNYHFEILKCKRCGLMRTYPMPSINQYLKNTLSVKNEKEDKTTIEAWSKMIARNLQKWCPQGSNILDLGCSTGNLVEELLGQGFQAIGCDINPVAVKKGIKLGRNIKLATLSECEFKDNFFDAVICNHALEHILGLNSTIQEIARILKKNGFLFIFAPYYRGLIPKIMGDNWMGWFAQQHIWHFDKKTLRDIILKYGNFKVVSIKSKGMIEPPSEGIKGWIKKTTGKIAGSLNFGDEIEAIFIKQ